MASHYLLSDLHYHSRMHYLCHWPRYIQQSSSNHSQWNWDFECNLFLFHFRCNNRYEKWFHFCFYFFEFFSFEILPLLFSIINFFFRIWWHYNQWWVTCKSSCRFFSHSFWDFAHWYVSSCNLKKNLMKFNFLFFWCNFH